MKIVVIVLAVIGAGFAVLIAIAVGFAFTLVGHVEESLQIELESDPGFVERAGSVESIDAGFGAGESFEFTGSKASGTVVMEPVDGTITLRVTLESGESFDVAFDAERFERNVEGRLPFGGSESKTQDPSVEALDASAPDDHSHGGMSHEHPPHEHPPQEHPGHDDHPHDEPNAANPTSAPTGG